MCFWSFLETPYDKCQKLYEWIQYEFLDRPDLTKNPFTCNLYTFDIIYPIKWQSSRQNKDDMEVVRVYSYDVKKTLEPQHVFLPYIHGWNCHPFAPPMTFGKAQLTRLNGPVALVYPCIELRREDQVSMFLVVTWCDMQNLNKMFLISISSLFMNVSWQ